MRLVLGVVKLVTSGGIARRNAPQRVRGKRTGRPGRGKVARRVLVPLVFVGLLVAIHYQDR
jgi:hypothetical protein